MTEVRKPSARSAEAQRFTEAQQSNRRIKLAILLLIGVVALVAVGIYVQGSLADDEARQEVYADARSALAAESVQRDEVRGLIRRLERFELDQGIEPESVALRARLMRRIGSRKDAWKAIQSVAERPGVDPEIALLGAEIASKQASATDDGGLLQRALAMANVASRNDSDPAALAFAAILSHRASDVGRFVDAMSTLFERHGSSEQARALRPSAAVLSGQIAARFGWDLTADPGGDDRIAGLKALVDETQSDRLREPLEQAVFPEQWIVSAQIRLLDAGEAIGEVVFRGVMADSQRALEVLPNSIEARHLMVRATAGLWQQEKATSADLSRLRGHLDWLLRRAPETHVHREGWNTLRQAL